jgi:peptidoglycan hydrolase CwlO-like protein
MEEQGKLSYWSVLFKANSFIDLLDRVSMINEIAASDQRRLKEISDAAEAVATPP